MSKPSGLPPLLRDGANVSVDVLVRVQTFRSLYTAYYNYYLQKWAFYPGPPTTYPIVLEWFPLPEIGTGVQVPHEKQT